jgi:hypothetical protein
MTGIVSHTRKAIALLTLLVTWEIWNGKNARVFNNKQTPSMIILEKKIKKEAKLWVAAGAKNLSNLFPGD